jgi:putative transposase
MADIFHVLNRGVDKRKIFLDNQDYFRFIHDLFEFNNQKRVNTVFYSFYKFNDIGCRKIKDKKPRKLLVDIHAFCLMPDHYHLLLSPRVENGIPKFMKKMNMGYAKYFNEKYKRKGTLFESRYKSILITEHAHFLHLPYYIHLNPLDLKFPLWREKKLRNYKEAMIFLGKYRWSSFLDYIGKKNFPSITNRKFLLDFFGGEEKYKKEILEWLKDMNFNVGEMVKGVALE